jgi:hypothetical protein
VAAVTMTTANLRGLCPDCGSLLHRQVGLARIAEIRFGDLSPRAPSPAPSR